ncbi:cellulose binding domain-containing protein, partial [Actinomadura rugatobispora]
AAPAENATPPPAASPSSGLPPGTPVGPAAPAGPPPQEKPRRPVLLAAVIAAMLVIGVGAIIAAVTASDSGGPDRKPAARSAPPAGPAPSDTGAPTGPASPGTTGDPAPGGTTGAPAPPQGQDPGQAPGQAVPPPSAPPAGPVVEGNGITYQLVQRDPGYYEGKFVFTNRTGRPMTDWTITFQAPGGNVKNIWGARLVRGGGSVEIRNLDNARTIPPGATWEIQFGAEGAAADPKGCRLNGAPCGF